MFEFVVITGKVLNQFLQEYKGEVQYYKRGDNPLGNPFTPSHSYTIFANEYYNIAFDNKLQQGDIMRIYPYKVVETLEELHQKLGWA